MSKTPDQQSHSSVQSRALELFWAGVEEIPDINSMQLKLLKELFADPKELTAKNIIAILDKQDSSPAC